MNEAIYPFEKLTSYEYAFTSIGRKGAIKKIVSFEEIAPGIYNVLLEDEIDDVRLGDRVLTDNGDALKVVNTTAAIIQTVLEKLPVTAVHIAGSTEQRNRTYQRRIVRQLTDFVVLGQKAEGEPFEPVNTQDSYIAFLVLSK